MVTEPNIDFDEVQIDEVMRPDDDLVEYLLVTLQLPQMIVLELQLYDEVLVETALELDELDDEKLDELVREVFEPLVDDEHRRLIEVDEMFDEHNFVDETEAEHIDTVVDDDGDEEMEVGEIVVRMMINEVGDEVDMLHLH